MNQVSKDQTVIKTTPNIKGTKLYISNGINSEVIDVSNPNDKCSLEGKKVVLEEVQIPNKSWGSCYVVMDDNSILKTGGVDTKMVEHMKKEGQERIPLKPMFTKRQNHMCGRFFHQGNQVVIVAGGFNSNKILKKVEVLPQENGQWTYWSYGPRLPKKKMFDDIMVSAQDTVYIVPNQPGKIWKLKCEDNPNRLECSWEEMEQEVHLANADKAALVSQNICDE